jgi:hypothetical protein
MSRRLTLITVASLLSAAPPAAAESWGFAAGGALVSGYEYRRYQGFQGTGYPFAAVQSAIHSRLWLRAQGGYMGFNNGDGERADWVPLGAGFRWQSVAGSSGLGGFLEFYPSVFLVRWRGETRYSYDPAPSSFASFTTAVPGFMTGVGFHINANERWHIDYGVHYHRSARLPEDLPGLNQFGFSVSFNWKPPVTRGRGREVEI